MTDGYLLCIQTQDMLDQLLASYAEDDDFMHGELSKSWHEDACICIMLLYTAQIQEAQAGLRIHISSHLIRGFCSA